MDAKSFVLALLGASEEKRITGKKRLQKLSMLLKSSGVDVDADFSLLHYGPFSFDIADATEELALIGSITEHSKPVGVFGTFQSEYTLSEETKVAEELPEFAKATLRKLHNFSTIELEVASTIMYFEQDGLRRADAIEQTISMKPNKAIPSVLKASQQILDSIKN